jgi:hypothetical protein
VLHPQVNNHNHSCFIIWIIFLFVLICPCCCLLFCHLDEVELITSASDKKLWLYNLTTW